MTLPAAPRNVALEQIDRDHFFHPYTALRTHAESGPIVVERGHGIFIRDSRGNEYIDGLAGLWCVNVGYGREEIAAAIYRHVQKLPYYHTFASMSNEPAILLAERIAGKTPDGLRRVLFGTSGSDANDTAIKLVWYFNNVRGRPNKKKIIARDRAYHGVTIAAGSLTGLDTVHRRNQRRLPAENPRRRNRELSASKTVRVPFPAEIGIAKRINGHALKNGLLTRPLLNSDILAFSPPLTIRSAEIDEMVRRLRISLDATLADLPASARPA